MILVAIFAAISFVVLLPLSLIAGDLTPFVGGIITTLIAAVIVGVITFFDWLELRRDR